MTPLLDLMVFVVGWMSSKNGEISATNSLTLKVFKVDRRAWSFYQPADLNLVFLKALFKVTKLLFFNECDFFIEVAYFNFSPLKVVSACLGALLSEVLVDFKDFTIIKFKNVWL